MKRQMAWTVVVLLAGSLAPAADKKPDPPKDPYAELFSFPPKANPDAKQKEKVAELREKYEPMLLEWDKRIARLLDDFAAISNEADKRQFMRKNVRERNALLTEEQREAAGIKTFIPAYASEKGLQDDKIWDLSQLEKLFTIQSRSYDPEEQVISFVVITKRKWTQEERTNDHYNWTSKFTKTYGLPPTKVQVRFWSKNEESMGTLDAAAWFQGMTRRELKLTDQEAEEGLLRYRIKIDLSDSWNGLKVAATVKFVYPEPK